MTTVDRSEIDAPSHYDHPCGRQIIDLCRRMDFDFGNALKYLARAGKKAGQSADKDRAKAAYYLRDYATYLEQEEFGGFRFVDGSRTLAETFLAHEPEGTFLGRILSMGLEGLLSVVQLRIIADDLDPIEVLCD